ncbi:MAG: hypothetical protein HUJ26_17345 [Planctomycetaceae bacterium]|nr:hypothetical protein [Planctomycetaceae bacterium]
MKIHNRSICLSGCLYSILFCFLLLNPGAGTAQETNEEPPEQVIVERETLTTIDAAKYQIPIQLRPSKFVTVVSPRNGVIDSLSLKTGDTLTSQSELFHLENGLEALQVKRAEAQVELQQLKLDQAKKANDAEAVALAELELKVASTDLEIANARLEATTRRAEWEAEVFRVYAVEGQFVSANQKVIDIGDPEIMVVEIPMNREDAKEGESVSFKVEDLDVQGKIVSVLPPAERFEPLRDLYDSLTSAVVEIENRSRRYHTGQAVYVPQIPRYAVAEVANSAITAGEEGQRKVQVIRENVVRTIPVDVLAPIGAERSYISGPFQEKDEIILSTSQPLEDGTQLAPKVAGEGTRNGTGVPGRTQPRTSPANSF